MKALSMTQPWAQLVAVSAKRVETRSWSTRYRGPLAIHAAKCYPAAARVWGDTPSFRAALIDGMTRAHLPYRHEVTTDDLPTGVIVATCRLVGCFRITRSLSYRLETGEGIELTERELVFGDYEPGRYGWLLADAKALPEPIPARGRLGLWDWDNDNAGRVRVAETAASS